MPAKGNPHDWWRGGVIYQVYPRSFLDTNADGVGDLKGIEKKLDYIAALGVDGVWISPFFRSPMADYGYDVSDYCDVDPVFGTMKDCDALIAAMKKRGLKMIVDFVMNHTSDRHAWFTESRSSRDNPKAAWYVWADPKPDGTPPNNWMSVFGGPAWRFDTRRGQYYLHQFLKEQPDLNVANPAVQDELLRIARWWLERGVGGFRLDALNHCMQDTQLRDNPARPGIDLSQGSDRFVNPYSMQWHRFDKSQPEMIPFLLRIRALLDEYPGSMTVAEVNDDHSIETTRAYTGTPDVLHTAYSFSLLGDSYSAASLRAPVQALGSGAVWPSWAFSNHDVRRVATRWAQGGKPSATQAKMLVALLCSMRGTPFLYQGEELGLTEADVPFERLRDPFGIALWPTDKGRDGCRTPMPWNGAERNAGFSGAADTWLPVPDDHAALSVAVQENDASSTLHFTRNFLKWRKSAPSLVQGEMSFVDTPEPVLAFVREAEGEKIFCAFNLGAEEVTIAPPASCTPRAGHGLHYNVEKDGRIALPGFGGFFGNCV